MHRKSLQSWIFPTGAGLPDRPHGSGPGSAHGSAGPRMPGQELQEAKALPPAAAKATVSSAEGSFLSVRPAAGYAGKTNLPAQYLHNNRIIPYKGKIIKFNCKTDGFPPIKQG